jgi:hypothetical protein
MENSQTERLRKSAKNPDRLTRTYTVLTRTTPGGLHAAYTRKKTDLHALTRTLRENPLTRPYTLPYTHPLVFFCFFLRFFAVFSKKIKPIKQISSGVGWWVGGERRGGRSQALIVVATKTLVWVGWSGAGGERVESGARRQAIGWPGGDES